ncbi:hypothetical protein BKA70DRAFT_356512 [Coprinopsis sp. MPI-PUGE-AT-0042]|nr:hypothetical protein BKA70DRAFT_356512 [Coprinopsis sp. MPI-PUGE-AT-0042]
MSLGLRWVVLDGDSQAFNFTGDWNAESGTSAYLGTLWTTTDIGPSGGSMSFSFNGTVIVLIVKLKAAGGGSPAVSCNSWFTVDGKPTWHRAEAGNAENFACQWEGEERTDDGKPHTLLLNLSIPEESSGAPSSFSLDAVWYLPALDSGPLLDPYAFVQYDDVDPHIEYSPGDWEPFADRLGFAVRANQTGSSVTALFTGTKIVCRGWTVGSGRSSGTYYIDGGKPFTFAVASTLDSVVHGVKLIEIDGLPAGAHNLTIVHDDGTPLVLDDFLVQGGDYRITAALPTPSIMQSPSNTHGYSTPRPTASLPEKSPTEPSPGSVPTGAIAGGTVGAFALFILALYTCVFFRKRGKKRDTISPNPSRFTHPFARSAPSSATQLSMGHTSQSILATAHATSLPSSSGVDHQQFDNGLMSLQDPNASHGPSSSLLAALKTPISLRAQDITTSQGDVALAARDVHMHKHDHHYHGSWTAAETGTKITNGQTGGETTGNHSPLHHEGLHPLDEPHSRQQTLESHRPEAINQSRSFPAAMEEESSGLSRL